MSRVTIEQEYAPIWSQLFEKPRVDRSITKYEYVSLVDSEGSSGINNKQTLKFRGRPGSQYMIPSHAYLDIVYKIVKAADGTDYDPGDIVTSVGNPIFMFDEARLLVNGRPLETHINPGISAHINYLAELPSTMLNSTGDAEGFIPEKGSGTFDINPLTITTIDDGGGGYTSTALVNADYNEGFDKRYRKSRGSQYVQVKIPLARIFNFLRQTNVPITGVDIEVEFKIDRSFNKFILKNNAAALGKVFFQKFHLMMPYIEPSAEVEAAILDEFSKNSSTSILYEHQLLRTSPQYALGTQYVRWEILNIVTVPTAVSIIFLPLTATVDGDPNVVQQNNPCLFRNMDVKRISLMIGNIQYPAEEYQCNFDDNTPLDYVRLYQDYISSTQCCGNKSAIESVVSYEDFRRLTTIFHFDLSYIDVSKYDWSTSHAVRLQAELGTPAAAAFEVHALIGKERLVKLNFTTDRRLLLDFNNE